MNLEELLVHLKVPFLTSGHHHCREGWIQLESCPFCGSQNYHLGYSQRANYFSCWRCGGHRASSVLAAIGASKQQAKEFLDDRDVYVPVSRAAGKLEEPKHRGPLQDAHRQYLRSRGFDPDHLVKLWELEGIGIATDLSWRIYIPIVRNGERVSWTTRTIGMKNPLRYIAAGASKESYPAKHCLYGADFACHSVVVVEGPADAWRIGPGAVALFGTSFTTAQVSELSRFPYRYILFDNSPQAQFQAEKLATSLSCFDGRTTILRCDAEDPATMSTQELKQLRRISGI